MPELKAETKENSADLIFTDNSIYDEASHLKSTLNCINKAVSDYLKTMQVLKESGIMAGETENALSAYIDSARPLMGLAKSLGKNLAAYTNKFLTDIDSADGYLY